MQSTDVIVVTGAAGFIGSYLTGFLNRLGFDRLVLVDDFDREDRTLNLAGKAYSEKIHRNSFFDWFTAHGAEVKYVFHLGARTDTTEMDYEVHRVLNLEYTKKVWQLCAQFGVPLVYASSAATYGGGEHGYADDETQLGLLQPLNAYGLSKHQFDIWALQQSAAPPFWAGLKFFNVYGPNEYHKKRMASVIFHAFNQIRASGQVKLFRSHHPDFKDGEQMRDFIYVNDIVQICIWLMMHRPHSGLYNTGTGIARTFKDLVRPSLPHCNCPKILCM